MAPLQPLFSPLELAGPNRHVPLISRFQGALGHPKEASPKPASNIGSILMSTAKHAIALAGLPEPTNP